MFLDHHQGIQQLEIMERRYGLRKGSWTEEEDLLLKQCIQKYGEGRWRQVPPRAGLNRCSKSCRLRWLNYLRPNIKRGQFEADEIDLILKMHKLLGNRWALIAGRLPGRTANDVKNYWNTHLNKKVLVCHDQRPVVDHEEEEDQIKENKSINNIHPAEMAPETKLIKPQPLNFSKNSKWFRSSGNDTTTETETETETETTEIQQSDIEMFINTTTDHEKTTSEPADDNDERMVWLESILLEREVEEEEEEEETAEDQMMISSDHHEVITTSSVRVDDGESAVLVEAKNDWDLLNVDDENFHFWHMLLLPDEQ